jgi:hypothetical protein
MTDLSYPRVRFVYVSKVKDVCTAFTHKLILRYLERYLLTVMPCQKFKAPVEHPFPQFSAACVNSSLMSTSRSLFCSFVCERLFRPLLDRRRLVKFKISHPSSNPCSITTAALLYFWSLQEVLFGKCCSSNAMLHSYVLSKSTRSKLLRRKMRLFKISPEIFGRVSF